MHHRAHSRRHPAVRLFAVAGLAVLLTTVGCSSSTPTASGPGGTGAGTTAAPSGYPLDDTLKLNQIQSIGSHNSYHLRSPKAFRDALEKVIPGITAFWDYEQPTLDKQFDIGVRQIELDVHLDPDGRYATRHAMPIAGLPAEGPAELKKPGLKVFHIQEIDFDTNCLTFVACLETVERWSDANPGHVPIMILVEAKDDVIPDPFNMNFSQPVKFDKAGLDAIDAEIRSVFDDEQMITPDQVRGTHETLEKAVLAGNWPTLRASRGKVMFGLDNGGLRKEYAEGHPSLQGRVMFVDGTPGEPETAFVKRNDAIEKTPGEIADLVKKGYVVRTRSDADAKEAKANDMNTAKAAIDSGANWISTDFPVPDPSVSATYEVKLPGGTPSRCNPTNAPPECKPSDIENPAYLRSR